jgi:hypothetical protein
MRDLFQRFRRMVEAAEPGIVDGPAGLEAEDDKPEPEPPFIYYAENHAEAGRWDRPVIPAPAADLRHCPNCAGLEQTVALLQGERRELRRRLAKRELPTTRDLRLKPSEQLP